MWDREIGGIIELRFRARLVRIQWEFYDEEIRWLRKAMGSDC